MYVTKTIYRMYCTSNTNIPNRQKINRWLSMAVTIHNTINRLSTAVTTDSVRVRKTINRGDKRERKSSIERQRNNQPAFTMGSMVGEVFLSLFGEILRNNVGYCCTNQDGTAGGGGELNNTFQIYTYF
jgi:hypothetical protein